MSSKPVWPREVARRDVTTAIEYYLREAGTEIALRYVDAVAAAYRNIAAHPSAGALRYAHELGGPGLRNLRLKRYPYLVFYMDRGDHIEVWRVLHAERDIPARMRETTGG
jgi:toxin ParE1/3/4